MLVYNTFIGGTPYGLYFFLPKLITQALYFGLIVSWLVFLLVRRWCIPTSVLDLPLIVLGGIILASALLARDPVLSLNDVVLYFTYIAFYFMTLERLRAGWPVVAFIKALVMTVSIVCLFALLEYLAWYFGWPLFAEFRPGWWSIGGWQDPLPPYWHRLEYTLTNPNLVAGLLAYTLPLGAAAVVVAHSRWRRLNAFLWLLLCSLVLVITFSRGGWLAALAGLLTFAALLMRRRVALSAAVRRRFLLGAGAGMVVLVGLAVSANLLEWYRPGSDEARLAMWRYALPMIRDHPLIGSGPRTYGARLLDYWDARQDPVPYVFLGTAHNALLQSAAELGIPGALLVMVIGLLVLRSGYRAVMHLPRERAIWMAGLFAGLVAFAVHNMGETLLSMPAVMLPVVMMAGILCSYGDGAASVPLSRRGWASTWGLGISIPVIIWAALSLYGMAHLVNSAAAVLHERWEEVIATLQRLPPGSLPTSFRQFQLALGYV
ncbi:MAG: O-antigen ligase family protein, partial [Anaerolineae bacterium]|nr:O-antigen ligase family protein [Anaerolineae bacterium]MDW8072566.1 O-antigen ligase family protein [Anaerolineae bacterium]